MLETYPKIKRVVIARGTVDLRKSIDGLSVIIGDHYGQNPFEKGTLFLFCGKRSDCLSYSFASKNAILIGSIYFSLSKKISLLFFL